MDQVELRKYLDIINENSEEVLTEGMLQKLAGLALGTVLALGPKIGQADTVYTYFDPGANKMQTVLDMSKVPASAKTVMAVDTDTQQVMLVRSGSPTAKEITPDPVAVKQAQFSKDTKSFSDKPQSPDQTSKSNQMKQTGKQLVGTISSGLTPEQIVNNNPNFKIVKPKLTNLGPIGRISNNFGISKNTIKAEGESTSPYGTQSDTFVTFDKNDKSDGVAYQIKISQLPQDWQDKGLLGYNRGQVENLVKEIIRNAPSQMGARTGKIKFRDSEGRVIGGTTIGYGSATPASGGILGIGSSLNLFSTKISNFVIIQDFENGKIVVPFMVTDDKYYQPEGNNMYVYIKDPNAPKDDLEFEPEFKNK